MVEPGEKRKQHPENFDARLAELRTLSQNPSRQDEYRARLHTYEEGEKGNLPDDLELALWDPEDYRDVRMRHQQEAQGESL